MNGLVIGKRIPIGAAVTGLTTFGAFIWNSTHPEMQLSIGEVGGLAIALAAIAQVFVVNYFGITQPSQN